MGEIVNLNKARKARVRAEAKAAAAGNRVTDGRTRTERLAAELEQARASRRLDGARLDKDAPERGRETDEN